MQEYTACFVIPNYNHIDVFDKVVLYLLPYKLPIFIVNDDSNQQTTEVLNNIDRDHALVRVLHLTENCGKGGAVIAGLIHAYQSGFTHAMQIDADGQHDLSNVEIFFTESQKNQQSLICGYPVYDESVPKGRLIPRYITHFWVNVETLSLQIKDSMCGFRVYPLGSVVKLIQSVRIGQRMDFDIEIMVRCYWKNIAMKFLPIKVIYPEGGVSHFRMLQDNWLISKMHTKLFFGMLVRSPRLLVKSIRRNFRQTSSSDVEKREKHWGASKEKGSLLGISFLIWIYRIFGRRLFSILLHPVIAYFVATSKNARSYSRKYWQHIYQSQGRSTTVSIKTVYKHFYEFGQAAIDKIACWMGDISRKDLIFHNEETIQRIAESGKGAVFIGAHLGNLELCRAVGEQTQELKINAVVFTKHALKFQQALSRSNDKVEVNLIHVESMGVDTAIILKQKIEQGEVVIIVGDRTSVKSFGRVQYTDFLGEKAPFSEGPYILAGLLDCPVYLLFCIKQHNRYNLYLEHFSETLRFPRNLREKGLKEVIDKFALRLAYYCQLAPYQWFNFYDFWQADEPDKVERLDI